MSAVRFKSMQHNAGWPRSPRRCWHIVSTLALCGLCLAGCTRSHYRLQADSAVQDAVSGATANPRFEIPEFDIAVDPRSRLFDPTDADRPPMPPDDADSARLMECVDGHRVWPHWHKDGDLTDVEVSDYRAWLPYDADGRVRIDMGGAVELARLHSRDYQSQMETLYLSALDVTAERFRFQSQFFGGNATQFASLGRIRNGGTSSSLLTTDTALQMQRAFTTGGTLVVGLANSIVWQFSGHDTSVNTSLLHFAISQPLLQYAGRPRIMETLTRSERNMLANVRQFDRFRQGFYLDVTTGNAAGSGLQRAGGLFGGSGLSGFTGVGTGGFGGVGAIGVTSSGGFAGSGGVGASGAGGYLGFLQNQQYIRNQRARIAGLRDTWLQLDAAFDAGRLESRFQVDFARQAYYTGQSELLSTLAGYESALDLYKIRLGLPPDVPFELRDSFLEQFNLIDPDLTQLQDAVADRIEAIAASQIDGSGVADSALLKELADRVRSFRVTLAHDMQVVEDRLPQRRQALEALARQPDLQENQIDLRAITVEALEQRIATLRTEHARLTVELTQLETLTTGLAGEIQLEPAERLRAEKEVLTRLSSALLELSLLQARARLHGVTLVPVDVAPETAFQVALVRRADWMNAKASLVDTWRLIRFNANALRSNLSVNVSGDLGTTGNNPVKFNSSNGLLTAGVQFDAPLTRVIERNQFRQSLIDYQQARRSLMAQRDEIHRGLRSRLRQIRLDQFNLELRRLAVDVAITQTDVARLKLVEPEKPVQDGRVAAPSPTIARDLVDALANLQQTQVFFIQVWTDYEIQRRLLDFDLGTMGLDDRGLWRDPGPLTNDALLGHYYDSLPDPFLTSESSDSPGYVELAPGDLPPEPTEFKPLSGELPSPPE